MAKLKVYRTPIGFHDAYVAAPSQKAALQAWGSDANLFARGVAEEVSDPELMKEPLAEPGKVIKRLRGTAEEQLAALPADPAAPTKNKAPRSKRSTPRPSRAKLEEAETALAQAEQEHRAALDELAERKAKLEAGYAKSRAKLEGKSERERAAYEKAMARWRE